MPARVVVDLNLVVSETAFVVSQRAIDQLFEFVDAERFELKNLRPRHERAVDIEKRIVSRRADQSQISAFDIGKENVLLRFVEMVDLVDEQNRLLPGGAGAIGRARDHTAHFGHIAFHATQPNELGVSHVGDDMSERGFSGARRPGQNHRWQTIGFNRTAKQFSRSKNMFLADKFIERSRSHPRGERRSLVNRRDSDIRREQRIDIFLFEQVLHGGKIRREWGLCTLVG